MKKDDRVRKREKERNTLERAKFSERKREQESTV